MGVDWLNDPAAAGATALLGVMVTDAWHAAGAGFARLLGRGDARLQALAEGRLEETRRQLEQGGDPNDRLLASWRTRLRDLLEEEPGAVEELSRLVSRYGPRPGPLGDRSQHITATGDGFAAGVMRGDQYVFYGTRGGGAAP